MTAFNKKLVKYLYSFSENVFSKNIVLVEKYSRYKYGSIKDTKYFSKLLIKLIKKEYRKSITLNKNDFILITPPFSKIPPPSVNLISFIGNELGVRVINLQTINYNKKTKDYSKINTTKLRRKIFHSMDAFIEFKEEICHKKIIFIDDSVVSGCTMGYSEKILREKYKVSDIKFFAILNVREKNLSIEDRVNRYVLLKKTGDLVKLLNSVNLHNRYVIKSLFTLDKISFKSLIGRLSIKTTLRLKKAAMLYYPKGEQDRKINFISSYCKLNPLNTKQ